MDKARNEMLTRVGRGTPMGDLLRRYWHPIGGASELVDNPIKAVRLMGEDLVLYQDLSGQYGLLGRHCPHRRADSHRLPTSLESSRTAHLTVRIALFGPDNRHFASTDQYAYSAPKNICLTKKNALSATTWNPPANPHQGTLAIKTSKYNSPFTALSRPALCACPLQSQFVTNKHPDAKRHPNLPLSSPNRFSIAPTSQPVHSTPSSTQRSSILH